MQNRNEVRLFVLLSLSILLWGPLAAVAQNLPAQLIHYPEIVLVNGKVLTADDKFTIAEAVAIRDGKFLAVGSNSLMRQMVGPQTRVIDVEGQTVIPGIINTHVHLADYAEKPFQPWKNTAEVLQGVKKEVATAPAGQWVIRWVLPGFTRYFQGLNKQQLDQVAPSNPVVVGPTSGGYYALNSLAIKKLSLPVGVEGIEKDAQTGELTGIITGPASVALNNQVFWLAPMQEKIQNLKKAIDDVVAIGTTTVHTKIGPDGLTALRELWSNKELKLRWRVAFNGTTGGWDENLFRTLGNLTGIGDDMLRLSGIQPGAVDSAVMDGGAWSFNRKLRPDPRLGAADKPFGNSESWKETEKVLAAAVKFGWSVTGIHSDGDRATAEVLAAYEKAKLNRLIPSKDQDIRVDHLTLVRSDEIQKMKDLAITPSVVAWHTFLTVKTVDYFYGADRVANMSPNRTLLEAGLKPAAEFGYGCPFWSMQIRITRKAEGQIWGTYQRISREDALREHTNYAAYYLKEPDRLGTIEPGKLADLVVVDGDYMKVPEDQIEKLGVSKVLLAGKVVFETDHPRPCVSAFDEMSRKVYALQ